MKSPLQGNHSKAGPVEERTGVAEVSSVHAQCAVCFPELRLRGSDDVERHGEDAVAEVGRGQVHDEDGRNASPQRRGARQRGERQQVS